MNAAVIIRDARGDELDKVSELIKLSYSEYKEEMPPDAWNFYLESITDVRSRMYKSQLIVAESGEELAGTVTLYINAEDSNENWPKGWAAIRLLAVHPGFRRLGVARTLMEECLERCREHGIATVGLHTTKIMSIALRMYENMGFIRAPEFDFHPRPGVTVMAFRLDLDVKKTTL